MFFLAIRHLVARRRQTLMTFMGIFFAASSFVAISGFFLGFQEYIKDQLINNDAHVRISAKEEFIEPKQVNDWMGRELGHIFWLAPPGGRKDNDSIKNPEGWYRALQKDPRVIAYSPQLVAQVMVTRASASISARLTGSEVLRQQYVTNIQNYMTEGKFTDIAFGGNRILVGDGILKSLGARVNETILLATGKAAPVPFKIVGSFHTGIHTIDLGMMFAAIGDVQKLNQTPSQVNEIAVKVADVEEAKNMANTWASLSEEKIQSWDEVNSNVLNVFNIQNATRYTITTVIILVASFGVYNILNMVVTQKRKEIAILRSMGFEQRDVVSLFLFQGIILGIAGGAIGVFVGYWLCRGIELIPFGGGGLGSMKSTLLVSFNKLIYIRGFIFAVMASTIASYLPARAAGKLEPIEIIRQGAE